MPTYIPTLQGSGLRPEPGEPPEGAPRAAIFAHLMARAASLGMSVSLFLDTPEGRRLYSRYVSTDDLASILKAAVDSDDPSEYFRRNPTAYKAYRAGVSVPIRSLGEEQ